MVKSENFKIYCSWWTFCTGHLRQPILKASKVVTYMRKSVNASEVLSDEKRLQAANSTRWTSLNEQFNMLKSILAVDEEMLNQLESYERKILSRVVITSETVWRSHSRSTKAGIRESKSSHTSNFGIEKSNAGYFWYAQLKNGQFFEIFYREKTIKIWKRWSLHHSNGIWPKI